MKPLFLSILLCLVAVNAYAETHTYYPVCTFEGNKLLSVPCEMRPPLNDLLSGDYDRAIPLPNFPEQQGPITITTECSPTTCPDPPRYNRELPDPCVAVMEAAMRSMEPYVWPMTVRGPHNGLTTKEYNEFMEAYRKAEKQWNEAKRTCWRDK